MLQVNTPREHVYRRKPPDVQATLPTWTPGFPRPGLGLFCLAQQTAQVRGPVLLGIRWGWGCENLGLGLGFPPHPPPNSKCGSKKKTLSKRFGQNFRSKLSVKLSVKTFGQNVSVKTFGQNFRSKLMCTQTLNNFYKPQTLHPKP